MFHYVDFAWELKWVLQVHQNQLLLCLQLSQIIRKNFKNYFSCHFFYSELSQYFSCISNQPINWSLVKYSHTSKQPQECDTQDRVSQKGDDLTVTKRQGRGES